MEKFSTIVCFAKGTLVTSINENTPIEFVKPNDKILTYNHELGKSQIAVVERVAISRHSEISNITFSNDISISTTNDHPFWIIGKGWSTVSKPASGRKYNLLLDQLVVGDYCLYLNDETLNKVRIVNIERLVGDYDMHTVSGGENHCYFANGILVHDVNLTSLNLDKEHVSYEDSVSSNY